MDPKSPLYNKEISTAAAIQVIDDWLSKNQSYMWAVEPEDLKGWIADQGETIKFGIAKELIEECMTTKMPGNANRGMLWIKEQWKKL